MTYLKRSSRPKKGRAATAAVAALLVLLFLIGRFFPGFYPATLYPVASVFWRAGSGIVGAFVSTAESLQSKYSLVAENKTLSDELAARDLSLLELDMLKSENDALKADLGRKGKGDYVLAAILSRPPVSPYDTLVIDIGSDQGVKQGDLVYAEGDMLVGDISAVYSGQSQVSLFSMPGRETSVLVGTSTVATQATGKGGGDFVLTLPARIAIGATSTVSIPGIRSHILGVVGSIQVDPTDSLQTILFRSPVNTNQLRYVEVDRTTEGVKK